MYNHLRLLGIAAVKLCREFDRIFGIEGYNASLDGNMGKT